MSEISTREVLQDLANRPIGGPEFMAEAARIENDPNAKPSAALKEVSQRANKLWLPQGRKAPTQKSKEPDLKQMAEGHAHKARQQQQAAENLAKLLDYYATTSVPIERVAAHLGKADDLVFVRAELRKRGRVP